MQKGKSDRIKRANRDDKSIKHISHFSNTSQILKVKNKSTTEDSKTSVPIIPTPIDFDNFIPWVCREWGVPYIVKVIRVYQEENVDLAVKKMLLEDLKEKTQQRSYYNLHISALDSLVTEEKVMKLVIIEAHYDVQKELEELSFVECSNGIPKKVIRAINLCLPFHSKLTRINIRKGCLNHNALCEMAKMLPHSNITILFLDDSVIPQGHYQMLLRDTSQLSYLSLNRCGIKDDICKEIAMNLTFGKGASNSINVLELASNDITDIGAEHLGKMLHTNRRLLHLNLAGNKITDRGGKALIAALMEFSLTCDEVLEMKTKRYKQLKEKNLLLKKSLNEVRMIYESSESPNLSVYASLHSATSKLKTPNTPTTFLREGPQNVSASLDSEFLDPYTINNLELRNGCYIAKGNFIFCSLNLAYNELNYPFLKKIEEILAYQHAVKFPSDTGLIRIVLDGNYMPAECPELDHIRNYLKVNIDQKQPKPIEKKRQSSTTSRRSLSKGKN